jgi:hypothetical protein
MKLGAGQSGDAPLHASGGRDETSSCARVLQHVMRRCDEHHRLQYCRSDSVRQIDHTIDNVVANIRATDRQQSNRTIGSADAR